MIHKLHKLNEIIFVWIMKPIDTKMTVVSIFLTHPSFLPMSEVAS